MAPVTAWLPIEPLLPEIVAAMTDGQRLLLRAAPGAGKTTGVPAALLDGGCAGGKQVVVLEPRRIAARAAAEFVAAARGGAVGEEVGYRVRYESRGNASTRLWFLTEGVLGRQLGRDPFLEEVGLIVLDEFHERHLPSDVALAIVRELQDSVRPDLKLAVMSATLDTAALAAYLGPGVAVVTSEGRAYPVRVEYRPGPGDEPLAARVAAGLAHLLGAADDDGGDVLVFLPGAAEIRRAHEAVASLAATRVMEVLPLHGDLSLAAQRAALQRGAHRRVILATNVAETSLTVEGVTAVIDSGVARLAAYDARRGINALRPAPISRAAAEQRAGRAGRLGPGRCLRLWSAADHAARLARETPEIHRLELSGTALEVRAWGARDITRLAWLDPPRRQAAEQAERLLVQLGAVTADGAATELGRHLLRIPTSPRLARLLIEAHRRGAGAAGALAAALAGERDVLSATRALASTDVPWPDGPCDLRLRAELFGDAERAGFADATCRRLGLDRATLRQVARARLQLIAAVSESAGPRDVGAPAARVRREQRGAAVGTAPGRSGDEAVRRAILAAFPDRVCRRRAPGSARAVMVGGTGVALDPYSVVRQAQMFVAVDIERGSAADARVRLASAIEVEWLGELFPEAVQHRVTVEFDVEQERVVQRSQQLYRDLVLAENVAPAPVSEAASAALAAAARADPARAVCLSDADRALLAQVCFLRRWMPELGLPDADDLLAATVEALCAGKGSFAALRNAALGAALRDALSAAQRHALACQAPARLALPSGRSVAITYAADRPPAAAARIQEVFGLLETPRLAGGRVALVLELLAPNHRPVQVTDDLTSFWRRGYAEVRKQLRGRYPKHAWPEDPLTAEPSARVSRRTGRQ